MLSPEEIQAVVDLFPFLSENPVVFDGGSNKGSFSEIFIQEYKDKCQLHLFEPNQMLLDYTRIKFEYEKGINYSQLGISDKQGEKSFYYFENYNNEISSIYPDEAGGWEGLPMKEGKISVTSVDEYCTLNSIKHIDFLKLDIEGSEVDAINGCIGMLNSGDIKIIQIEYGGHYVRSNRKFQEVIDLVTPLGYKIYRYIKDNFWELKDFKEDYAAENFYITKEEIHNYSADGGWMNPFILSVCDLPKFDLILELGCYEGLTTKYMAENMLNEGGRVIAVDPLMDVYIKGDTDHPYFKGQYQRFLRNTRGFPIELKRGDSEIELPKLNALRFDFSYIDGNHWPPHPYNDASWVFAETKVGGYILLDDYTWNDQTQGSIDKFLNEFAGSLEIVSKGYQVLIRKTQNQYNELTYEYYK
jgi:FkbM family methyltransferase